MLEEEGKVPRKRYLVLSFTVDDYDVDEIECYDYVDDWLEAVRGFSRNADAIIDMDTLETFDCFSESVTKTRKDFAWYFIADY